MQLLINHDGLPLSRTTNGSPQLAQTPMGLEFDATVDKSDPVAAGVLRKIAAGLLDQCSFSFRVTRQTWDSDYENREIEEVDMHRADVSVVNQGANPNTSVNARARTASAGIPPSLQVYVYRTHALALRGRASR